MRQLKQYLKIKQTKLKLSISDLTRLIYALITKNLLWVSIHVKVKKQIQIRNIEEHCLSWESM